MNMVNLCILKPLRLCPLIWMVLMHLSLTQYEKAWLNAYHQEVYEKISPYLKEEEQSWLREATRAI